MGWTLTGSVEEFLARAGGFLRDDPVRNTVVLTVTEGMRGRGPRLYQDVLFGWWTSGGHVEGACMWTGAHPPLLSTMPEQAAPELAAVLAGQQAKVPGVNATPQAAAGFAEAWTRLTGETSRVAMRQCLHRLSSLRMPDPPPEGAARIADHGDLALLRDWFAAFHRDAGGSGAPEPAAIEGRLAEGALTLWETGGRPVAMAGRTSAVEGMARVSAVYTPAEQRRRGYGAAVTAAVTQGALDAGVTDVVLFTDLANPTSNGVYRRLGYRPVEDRTLLTFK
jgi:predicted GNAT family acetyltransferase